MVGHVVCRIPRLVWRLKKLHLCVVKVSSHKISSVPSKSSTSHGFQKDKDVLSRLDQKDWLAPNEVLKLFINISEPKLVLSALRKVSQRKDYKPTEALYSIIIEKLAGARMLDAIEDILNLAKSENCRLSDEFFYRLIKIYNNIFKHPEQAMKTLLGMPDFQCWPSVKTFNCVLNMLVCEKQYDVIHEIYLSASQLGVKVDTCSFNILLKGLCQVGKLDSAFALLGELPKQGVRPNATTYSTIMHGLCKHNKLDEAFDLFDRMEIEGCYPDSVTFNILISGLCKHARIDEAKVLLNKMQLKGCAPNSGSYQALLYGLLNCGKFVEAKDFMVQMVSKGIYPSFLSYKMVIDGLCRQAPLNEVDWVLKQMVQQGFIPRMGIWKKILENMSLSMNFVEYKTI
ncbi:pentatricopeptide repeat-containing protein At3g14580, mitochondrial-like [Aristolochia californica]|uniref:pentatricopeptide repeat-containing protein At3g14580, mitochondrial-like n=1 Tax=Aristolochia californica TaxID=171875 RepID=UPI0035E189E8